jgi:uncharacterized membrane protein (DUF106 family)
MLEIIRSTIFDALKAFSPIYGILIVASAYVFTINVIIRKVTDQEEKRRIKGEIKGIKSRIKESRPGFIEFLRKSKEERRAIIEERKANNSIKEERKRLSKLMHRSMLHFTLKPMLFYLPLLLLIFRPIRSEFQGAITEPVTLVIGISLLFILVANHALKRIRNTSIIIEGKSIQFMLGMAGVILLFKSSLSMLWFFIVCIFTMNLFVKRIMGVE